MFDIGEHLDGLRCRPTHWLAERRDEVVREQRRLHVEELALTRVLDERGAIDETIAGHDGTSVRSVREALETARALESLPRVAAAAHAGTLSAEQLAPVAMLADEHTDEEWAQRAADVAPNDLARLARTQRTPTVEDGQARRNARELRMWWQADTGMLNVRGQLPDLDGARFEAVINQMTDRMRPAKGQPWDTRAHRAADALVALTDRYEHFDREEPTRAPQPLLVVQVPLEGPAEIAGIPLPEAMVETLRANAKLEPVLVDAAGVALAHGTRSGALSPKIARAVLRRDGHCRIFGCDARESLEIHHLLPKSWGGTDDPSNLAAVCKAGGHHQMLVPQGPWALVGNPNRPDGLRLIHRDEAFPERRERTP
jgi:hypothetical protein